MRWLGVDGAPSHRLGSVVLVVAVCAACGRTQALPDDGGSVSPPNGGSGAAPSDAGGAPAATGGTFSNTSGTAGAGDPAGAGAGGNPVIVDVGPPRFDNYAVTGSWPNRPIALAIKPGTLTYTKLTVHDRFLAESCAIGDYDADGNPDISSGRRWYAGPSFTTEHVFRGGHDDLPRTGNSPELVTGVADDQADYAFDLDGDGDVDIINVASPDVDDTQTPSRAPAPQPHATAFWYENPGKAAIYDSSEWPSHKIHGDVRHEQHGIGDVDGDGWPELYGACKGCMPNQTFGYYRSDAAKPTGVWTYHAVTHLKEFPFGGTGWMHGLGFGDVSGDGRVDLLEARGVWIDVLAASPNVTACPGEGCGHVATKLFDAFDAPQTGGSHMYAFDVDGDGDNDIISADWAHGYGISWYEQTAAFTFTKHRFVGSPADSLGNVVFSQPHALEVADMDADGVPEVITGKTRLANPNGCGDPDLLGDPVNYVFKILRDTPSAAGSVTFEPHPIDTDPLKVGVGRQIAIGHLDTDGILDICLATKLGLYVFLGQ